MTLQLYTVAQVAAYMVVSRSLIYKLMQEGVFPPPLHVRPRCSRWPADELDLIVGAWKQNADDETLRALVARIVQNRKETPQ